MSRQAPFLNSSWGRLGLSWAPLGLSWGPLGPSWNRIGVLLGRLGAILGASWAGLDAVKIPKSKIRNMCVSHKELGRCLPLGALWGVLLERLQAIFGCLRAFPGPVGGLVGRPGGLLGYPKRPSWPGDAPGSRKRARGPPGAQGGPGRDETPIPLLKGRTFNTPLA